MARINVAPVRLAIYPPVSNAVITGIAADATEKQKTLMGTVTYLVFRNSGATTRSITITSVPDSKTGRSGDYTFTVAAGVTRIVKLPREGWMQTSGADAGYVYYEAAHAEVICSAFTD